jgi:hypothetical protein
VVLFHLIGVTGEPRLAKVAESIHLGSSAVSDRHQDLELPASPERVREIVRTAGTEMGWQVRDESGCVVVRGRRRLLSGEWPIGIRVSIKRGSGRDRSSLSLWGRIGGFGPFVAERLKEEMEAFATLLRSRASSG